VRLKSCVLSYPLRENGRLRASGRRRGSTQRRIKAGAVAGYVIIGLAIAFVVYLLIPTSTDNVENSLARAAIVDQLNVLAPNQEFVQAAADTMQLAGLNVEVFGPDGVTVGLYQNLPKREYKLIVFRAYAGVKQEEKNQPVGLYTTESYNELSYSQEQSTDLIVVGRPFNQSQEAVFAVTPKFIRERSVANYPGTIIVLMEGYGLHSRDLPQAFIDRGASVVIGWDGSVGLDHADKATLKLLEELLTRKLSISDSVETTMDQVGADPDFNSVLLYYPKSKGSLTFSQLFTGFATATIPRRFIDDPQDHMATRHVRS